MLARKSLLTPFFLFIIFLQGCLVHLHQLRGLWFYTYSSKQGLDSATVNPAGFLDIQEGGSYSEDLQYFSFGHWHRKDSLLILTDSQHYTTTYVVRSLLLTNLELKEPHGTILHFEMQPTKFASESDDPFSLTNNRWRIPPGQKENEKEIRRRLGDHFHYFELYLEWALDNHVESIDFRNTPSPLKIFGNGLALKNYNELPVDWRHCFYDSADCQKASDIIGDIFEQDKIHWVTTNNRYSMFISAFQQMEQLVK
jgi:hypothetical protein